MYSNKLLLSIHRAQQLHSGFKCILEVWQANTSDSTRTDTVLLVLFWARTTSLWSGLGTSFILASECAKHFR